MRRPEGDALRRDCGAQEIRTDSSVLLADGAEICNQRSTK